MSHWQKNEVKIQDLDLAEDIMRSLGLNPQRGVEIEGYRNARQRVDLGIVTESGYGIGFNVDKKTGKIEMVSDDYGIQNGAHGWLRDRGFWRSYTVSEIERRMEGTTMESFAWNKTENTPERKIVLEGTSGGFDSGGDGGGGW